MTYARINRNSLGQFTKNLGRVIHVSAEIVEHPKKVENRVMNARFAQYGATPIPYYGPEFSVAKGVTYEVGKNQAKRERKWGRA